jgi:hypothetical protein
MLSAWAIAEGAGFNILYTGYTRRSSRGGLIAASQRKRLLSHVVCRSWSTQVQNEKYVSRERAAGIDLSL